MVISHDSKGYVTITNKESGKVLDLEAGVAGNLKNIRQYTSNGSDAQKWVAVKNSDSSYTFYSKVNTSYALDVDGDKTPNSTNVQLFSANKSNGQKWDIQSVTFVALHKDNLADGTYTFARPQFASSVMDLEAGSHAHGANIRLFARNKSDAQKWVITHDSAGYVIIRNKESGKALDVAAGIAQDAQKWVAVKNSNGTYTFFSKLNTQYAIDVAADATANFTNIALYKANGSNAQQWKLQ